MISIFTLPRRLCPPLFLAMLGLPCLAQAQEPPPADPETAPVPTEQPAHRQRVLQLSLDAVLTLAETNNLGLMIEDVANEVSLFNAKGARGKFDWVVGANFNYRDFRRNPSNFFEGLGQITGNDKNFLMNLTRPLETGGSFAAEYTNNRSVSSSLFAPTPNAGQSVDNISLTYTQPLLRGFGIERGMSELRESDVLYLQQRERRRQILQQLLRSTADAYWDLVSTGQQLEVAQSSLGLGREQLERNRRLLEAGVGTEVEVIQAEAEVATRGEVLLAAEVAVEVAEDALKVLLFPGKDQESWDAELVPTTGLPEDVSVEGLAPWGEVLERALHNRPELRQAELALEVAKIRHQRAVVDRRYGVDLNSSVASEGRDASKTESTRQAIELQSFTWQLGLTIDAPIQNRTRLWAERAARAQLRTAHIQLEQQETTVVAEVRNAVRQLRYQSLAVAAASESLRAAVRQLEAEVARYENDLSTNFQVLEYQLRLVEAMNNERIARANFAKAIYQMYAAEGTLGERHRAHD